METNFKECDQRLKEENSNWNSTMETKLLFPLNSTPTSLETNNKESRFLQFVTKEAPLDSSLKLVENVVFVIKRFWKNGRHGKQYRFYKLF